VTGVARLGDVVYVACGRYPTIRRFSATTYQRLADARVNNTIERFLGDVTDVVACERTSDIYVAECRVIFTALIWRMSADGAHISPWLRESPKFKPWTLSLTKSRLLVTLGKELTQYDVPSGRKLNRVLLPDDMDARHAVESPTGTFVVGHANKRLNHGQVSEVSALGRLLRQFSYSLGGLTQYIAVDSRGNIFVADPDDGHILLLDARLALRRVIIGAHQLNNRKPQRLCYTQHSGQLLVGLDFHGHVAVFDVLYRHR